MASVNQFQAPKANATAFSPNWEGAIIGAGVAVPFAALSGALLGVYTDWTFKGFEAGVANALGFDPIAMLTGAPPPAAAPVAPAPPKPVLGNGSGVPLAAPAAPKPAAPPAAASPVAPKPAAPPVAASPVAPKPAAPPVAASPAPKPAMGGMAGMSHGGMAGMSHGGMRPVVGEEDWE